MSENKTDQTVQHKATDLKPVQSVGIDKAQSGGDSTAFSVLIEGQVYGVKAKDSAEAADKAKKLHKNKKGTK